MLLGGFYGITDFGGYGGDGVRCLENRNNGIVRIKREVLDDDVPPALVGDGGFNYFGGSERGTDFHLWRFAAIGRVGEKGGFLIAVRKQE